MRVEFASFRNDRLRQVQQRIAGYPNWAVRAALITFAIVVMLPVVALVLIAGAVAILVLGVLSILHRLRRALGWRQHLPWRRTSLNGRRNVTVLQREG